MSGTVLVVEDEDELASVVVDYVVAAGYAAERYAHGRAALARLQRAPADLVVLDLMLPGLDGLSVCRAVRAFSAVPIIMVTARVEEVDRLLGLETGADDYLCKPFSPRELVARIKAVLRRVRGPEEKILEVDATKRTIRVRGVALDLTPTEYDLLAALASRPGVIHTRAQLMDLARRDNLDVSDRAIDTHVKNVRRKLAAAAPELELLRSVYGLGYRVEV